MAEDGKDERAVAITRLTNKRDFRMHLGSYVIVNLMLVGIWATTGQNHFWPIWVILFWGVGLAFHGWWAYLAKPFTEDEIEREMHSGH